jgi:serine/threonine-protein kinase
VKGSPLYMAPEQATGRPLDIRCDLYALGGVAYYLLTGKPPFDGDSAVGVMLAHARDPVDPPSKYHAGIPADLESVVLKCLAKQPDDRYGSAREVEVALATCESAGAWDPARADAWWRTHEPALTGKP